MRFLRRRTYHVVVRGGSHFCQSPRGGGQEFFLIKMQGRANTFFQKKNIKIPPRKNVPSLNRIRKMVSSEPGKEIEKVLFRLVTSVGQRKHSESP